LVEEGGEEYSEEIDTTCCIEKNAFRTDRTVGNNNRTILNKLIRSSDIAGMKQFWSKNKTRECMERNY